MGGEHEGCAERHSADVINEDDALGLKLVDDKAIVHNLVVAVNRCGEDAYHPRKGLNGLFHASAETSRFSEDDSFDVHKPTLSATLGKVHCR